MYSLFGGDTEERQPGTGWRVSWAEDLPARSGETGVPEKVTSAQRPVKRGEGPGDICGEGAAIHRMQVQG